MRVAVISDIHGNLHALEAVLAELEHEQPDELWCLGDLVGYGPQPNRCCELVRGACGDLPRREPRPRRARRDRPRGLLARRGRSARWTRERARRRRARAGSTALEPRGERDGVAALPRERARPGLGVHPERARRAADDARADERAARPRRALPRRARDRAARRAGCAAGLARAGNEIELDGSRWLLNPGSVGQPRDGDPRAAYLLLDLERAQRRVPARRLRRRADAGGDPGAWAAGALAERLAVAPSLAPLVAVAGCGGGKPAATTATAPAPRIPAAVAGDLAAARGGGRGRARRRDGCAAQARARQLVDGGHDGDQPARRSRTRCWSR